jgi:hypothetical protein
MEPSPSSEAANRSATQEFPNNFMESEDSWLCSKEFASGPYHKPHESTVYHPILFL